jgi:hypothetical protein
MPLTNEQKCEMITRDIRTPWGRKRLAKAMYGEGYDPPSEFELRWTPHYLWAEDLWDRFSRRTYSLFLRTFVGIDNRSYDEIHRR